MNTVEFGREHTDVIVLLHGGGLSWWQYEEAALLLADRFRVVLPMLDGHAGSDAPFTTIEDNARRVIDYLDRHSGGHILLLGGCSLGAQIATGILSQRGDICDYAVLESALVGPMPVTAACTKPMLALSYPLIRQRWFARLQFRSLGIKPALFEQYVRDTACITQRDMAAFLAANAAYRLPAALSGCRAQALILVGSRELPVMKRSARRLAAALPHSTLEVLPGLGHGAYSINHADQFARRLRQLVDG